MKNISFTEFRKNASELFDLVEHGETLKILRHGRSIAKITPLDGGSAPPAWKRSALRLKIPGASLSRAILEERQESL